MTQTFALVNLRNPTKINFLLDGKECAFSNFLSKILDNVVDLKYIGSQVTDESLHHLRLVAYKNNLPINEYHFSVSRMGIVDSFSNNFSLDSPEYYYQLNQINLMLNNEMVNNKITVSQAKLPNTNTVKSSKVEKHNNKELQSLKPTKNQIEKLTSMMSKFKKNTIQIKKPDESLQIPEMTDTEEQNARLKGKYTKEWKNNDGVSDITTEEETEFNDSDDDSISEYDNSDKDSIFDPELLDDEDLENLDPELIDEMYNRTVSMFEEKNKELEEKKNSLEKQTKNYGRFIDKLNDEKRIIRVLEEKEEQRKRIFESDKSVYYKVFKQLEDGKITEKHIPIFFKEKYPIFKYMDEQSFLEDEKEYSIYLLLFNKINSKEEDKRIGDKVKSLNIFQQYYLDEDELADLNNVYEEHKDVIDNFVEFMKEHVASNIPSFDEAMADAESDDEVEQCVMTQQTNLKDQNVEKNTENNKNQINISNEPPEESDGLSSYVTSEEEEDNKPKDDKLEPIKEETNQQETNQQETNEMEN